MMPCSGAGIPMKRKDHGINLDKIEKAKRKAVRGENVSDPGQRLASEVCMGNL